MNFGEDAADEVVGGLSELAVGMELVPDGDPGAGGEHDGGFVLELSFGFEGPEVAPHADEAAREAAHGEAEGSHVARHYGEVEVADGGRKGLYLEICDEGDVLAGAYADAAVVVERKIGADGAGEGAGALDEFADRLASEGVLVLFVFGVEAALCHFVAAELAVAGFVAEADDVVPEAVGFVILEDLLGLRDEDFLDVGAVEADGCPASGGPFFGRRFVARGPVCVHLTPVGMVLRDEFVPGDAVIDGGEDAALVAGGDHLAEEVEVEAGVHGADFRVIVGIAVMAFREDDDGIHVRVGEG